MTISSADVARHGGPVYQAIAEALAAAIAEGRLKPGDRLPPQRELAWQLTVTVGTVGRAYELVIQRGLIRGEVGRGTFVLDPKPAPVERWLPSRPDVPGPIDLAINQPAPVPAQSALASALAACAADPRLVADLAVYPPILGLDRHREAAAIWMTRQGAPAEPARVAILAGAQSALAASLAAIAPPGSTVLVEALTYSGLRTLARRLGLRLEPVALDGEGAMPDALEAAARHHGAKVAVLVPSLHNPTTATAGEARRRRLAQVADALGLWLIEDDVYGPLLERKPPTFASLLPERTIYLSSVSKFLAPGLRLAFAVMPACIVHSLREAMAQITLANSPLTAEVFRLGLETGLLMKALAEQRTELATRHALVRAALQGHAWHGPSISHHLWLPLPDHWTSAEFAVAMAQENVIVAPAERFHVGRGAAPRGVRLSISGPRDRDCLGTALGRVAERLLRGPLGGPSLV